MGYPTTTELVHQVFQSDKFQKTVMGNDIGFMDKSERVFIPKASVPIIIRGISQSRSILDSGNMDEYFALCQIRVNRTLSKHQEHNKKSRYKSIFYRYIANQFFKGLANTDVTFTALYIDLVGSTLLSMKLSSEKLSSLIDMFTDEMTSLVSINHGYTLKYAGDAVIAVFPETQDKGQMYKNALRCAIDMRNIVMSGINTSIEKNGFEPLSVRIGIESGMNRVMIIGGLVDIIGKTMNIASKIQTQAKPNGISTGQDFYNNLDDVTKQALTQINIDPTSWRYKNDDATDYKVYTLKD